MATLTMMASGDNEQLGALIWAGLERLELSEEAPASDVVAAVDAFLPVCGATLEQRSSEVALVFGDQLRRALGWGWAAYQEDDQAYEYAVVAADRSLWLRPETLVEKILGEDDHGGVSLRDVLDALVDGRIAGEPDGLSEIC
jgi:hypothetical protein